MAIESAADRLAFLSADDFGVSATYTPTAGGAVTIEGIFDEPSADVFNKPGMVTAGPHFICRSADLPGSAAVGDEIAIEGTDYIVQVIRPDGTGMTDLQLEEAD